MIQKNRDLFIIGSVFLFVLCGISYAYWKFLVPKDPVVVLNDCLVLKFPSEDQIHLLKSYPISDENGLKGYPYTFSVQNVCNEMVRFQVNMETLLSNGKKLPDEYLKVGFEEEGILKSISKLESSLFTVNSFRSENHVYRLFTGMLDANQEKNFSLRLWMDNEQVTKDMYFNAEYVGKLSVVPRDIESIPTFVSQLKTVPLVMEGSGLEEFFPNDLSFCDNCNNIEYRYVGSDPNNYVVFNNELWRVIGLVNTPEGQRVKLIRDESIGMYSWDTSEMFINDGLGINEWSHSFLKQYLNEPFYQSFFSYSKEMIDDVSWNINNFLNQSIYASEQYNDQVENVGFWKGLVGLMSPNDYRYAISEASCYEISMNEWNYTKCMDNNWLSLKNSWTLFSTFSNSSQVYYVSSLGTVDYGNANQSFHVYPSVYLKTNVRVFQGNGEKENPFLLI